MQQGRKPKTTKCIVAGCSRTQHARGVCAACYAAARKQVVDGVLTDAQLVEAGLWRASQYQVSPMEDAIAKLLKRQKKK